MGESAAPADDDLLAMTLRVPEHVVYRPFAAEMVVLNLDTGLYHGLNPTAGRMLLELDKADSVTAARAAIAGEYELEEAEIEADLLTLCRDLLDRGLLEPAADEG